MATTCNKLGFKHHPSKHQFRVSLYHIVFAGGTQKGGSFVPKPGYHPPSRKSSCDCPCLCFNANAAREPRFEFECSLVFWKVAMSTGKAFTLNKWMKHNIFIDPHQPFSRSQRILPYGTGWRYRIMKKSRKVATQLSSCNQVYLAQMTKTTTSFITTMNILLFGQGGSHSFTKC